ncbi:hypothetical protein Bsp3421_003376 [Burkholderia sp. FERM BP-3421]|uniref:hypothetical protein n=1 Tax=Burkholderia sp. FERM BP-3421 TaxID=1494466 RepID=UPI00235E119D|nr:hypothetical protein [Burkholderia sp. FERM BP-3421]WDD93305.1 hypothetical protein Bsp3421_003376 [Burkholderia sp. FERM BP-3421]
MPIVEAWRFFAVSLMVWAASAPACAGSLSSSCLTSAEVKQLDAAFWGPFPSPDGFATYAAADFSLSTNIVTLSELLVGASGGPARARAVATFLSQHPDIFGAFKTAHDSTYLYHPGRDHSLDALRASSTFPVARCVSEFNFVAKRMRDRCVYGQRIRAFSLSFIKDRGRVTLQTGVLGMEACS